MNTPTTSENQDAPPDSLHSVVGASGQLCCPKCRALTLNVHVSDIILANGRVTCSACGHERVAMKMTNEQRLKRQGMLFNHDGKCGKITL